MEPTTDLCIKQGATFEKVIRWETRPMVYVAVTAIDRAGPVVITAANHGCPDGWRAAVIDAVGMEQINAKTLPPTNRDWHRVTVQNSNQVAFNDVSSALFDAYESGGYLVYWTPQSLSGYTARMQVRRRVGGTLLETLHSADNEIVLDNVLKTITIQITATATAAYTWRKGVYDLELVDGTGKVVVILHGGISVEREVTTDA